MELELDLSDPSESLIFNVLTQGDMGPIGRSLGTIDGVGREVQDIGYPEKGVNLRSLTIDGFGPHDGPNHIELGHGTTLLHGRNGSGKSHMVFALNWCIFGRTGSLDPWGPEQEAVKELMNWNRDPSQGMEVSVEIDIGGTSFKSSRCLKGDRISESHQERKGDKWKKTAVGPLFDPITAPFHFYQGETAMFLSAEDPFHEKGVLRGVLGSMTGERELMEARSVIMEAKDQCLELSKEAGRSTDRIEGRLEVLRSRSGELGRSMEETALRIEKLSLERTRTKDVYLRVIENLTREGSGSSADIERTGIATRIGRLEERLSSSWVSASIRMIASQAERAYRTAMETREEEGRRRILFGAYEAQRSIVLEVIQRKSCICGTPIGMTGMGRERLDHLMEKINAKREEASEWKAGTIWTSDQFLDRATRDLERAGPGREGISAMLKELERARRKLGKVRSTSKDDPRSELIEAVRSNERNRVLHQEEVSKLASFGEEEASISREIRELEQELRDKLGTEFGMKGLMDSMRTMADAVERIGELVGTRTEKLRKDLEEVSTKILRTIAGDNGYFIRIHPESMRIGRGDEGHSETGTIPLNRLSAGERESMVLSIILGLSKLLGSTVVLDSPFSNLDKDSMGRALEYLAVEGEGTLVSVPTGSVPGSIVEACITAAEKSGKTLTVLKLVQKKNGTMVEGVGA